MILNIVCGKFSKELNQEKRLLALTKLIITKGIQS